MSTGRGFHTATLLNNGKVLVTGSFTSSGSMSASAELYDPASDTWSAAPSMSVGRAWHTATLLNNGKVLVAGGHTGFDSTASAELYDPASNTWSAASPMSTTRYWHTATRLNNGKVLVTGGFSQDADETVASAELYDPASNTWSMGPSMSSARTYHAATRLNNGNVLVTGGRTQSGDGWSSAELYDPASNTWSAAASLSAYRFVHSATLLANGKVLITGGYGPGSTGYSYPTSTELYDPATNTWSMGPSLSSSRLGATATLLSDGRVLVTGGDVDACCRASAELYGPQAPAPTTLTVPAVVHLTFVGLNVTLPFTATLTRTATGLPVAGKPVRFLAGASPACNATTNAQGVASCTYTLSSLLGVVLGLGYSAVFDGDGEYAASSGRGSLVG